MLFDEFDVSDFAKKDNLDIFDLDLTNILNQNIVKNFICKMNFEIGFMGFSENANCIAEFYNICLNRGNIFEFFNNETIKMIQEEMLQMPRLKLYLNERIFDEIEKDKIRFLNNIYINNDEMVSYINKTEKNWLKAKELSEKRLNDLTKKLTKITLD